MLYKAMRNFLCTLQAAIDLVSSFVHRRWPSCTRIRLNIVRVIIGCGSRLVSAMRFVPAGRATRAARIIEVRRDCCICRLGNDVFMLTEA
jgi:hypothetical protein